jgi:hypothetical protein
LKNLSDNIVYYEQGGASSQIVFTLPDGENLKDCLDKHIPKSSSRLSKMRKTHKKGSIKFNGWFFIVHDNKPA